MQPALVLAALALSVFFTGSETEGGQASRERAGMLRDLAQAAMESSLAVGWVDCNLAKAAWVREKETSPEGYTFANPPTSFSPCTSHNHIQANRFSPPGHQSDFLITSSGH
jgi:hypothetical protein